MTLQFLIILKIPVYFKKDLYKMKARISAEIQQGQSFVRWISASLLQIIYQHLRKWLHFS